MGETRTEKPAKGKGLFSNYLEKTKQLRNQYKTQLEIKYYEERLKKTPNDIELLKTYAKYLRDHKYYSQSIKIYKRLDHLAKKDSYKKEIDETKLFLRSQKKEASFSSYIAQGQKYESQGNIVKANEYYLKAKKILPERYEAQFGLAKTYCWLNQQNLAIEKYKALLKQAPKNVDLLESYAGCLKDNKEYARASEIYQKLFEITKNDKYKKNLQELASLQKGYSPLKIDTQIAQNFPKDQVFGEYINTAKKHESKGEISRANEYYQKAQREIPGKFEAEFGLAKTYGWLHQNKLALNLYKKLLKEAPQNQDLVAMYNKFLKESKGSKIYPIKPSRATPGMPAQNLQRPNLNAQKDNAFSAYIKQAQSYETEGNAIKSNEYYLKASSIYPSRYEAKFGLAKTYGWLHKDNLAQKYYQELLVQSPDNADLLAAYANYLKDNKHYSEAMAIYEKLVAKSEEAQAEKYNANIAEIFFLQKDYQTSLKMYFDIYRKDPNNPDLPKAIALNYFVSGDFENAIVFYQKYLTSAFDAQSMLNYGKSLFYSKRIPQAMEILQSYVNAYPSDVDGLSTLADIYVATKNNPQAIALIDRAIAIEPDNIKLQIQSAKIDISAKNYDKAQNLLLHLLAIEPNNADIMENLGDISFYSANFSQALMYFQGIPDFNSNPRLVYKVAQSYHYGKNHTVAQNLYRQLLGDPEYSNKSKIGLAEIQIEKDNPLKAISILNNVLENDPENVQAKKNLGISYFSMGDNLKSINILRTLPRDDSDVTYNLAKAYNGIERRDVALKLLKDNPQENAKALKAEIQMVTRPAIEPIYDFYYMNPNNGNLNAGKYQKAGANLYYYLKPNMRLVATGNTTQYSNLNNLVSTLGTLGSIGLEGKPTNHISYKSAIGFDAFSDDGANNLILGNAIVKASPNDVVTFTGGYIRSLDEIDSYMSAAGVVPTVGPFANQLVGRIVDNKYVMAVAFKLPHKFYAYGGMNFGNKYGSNSPSNFYKEIPAGFGKVVYSAKEERHINQALLGYDFYYTGYNEDMSGFGGANLNYNPVGSDGQSPSPSSGFPGVGGYFSPTFFIANKFPITLKGAFRKTKLKYILSAFVGTQTMEGQVGLLGPSGGGPSNIVTTLYYGYSLGLRYNEKGRYSIGLDYIFNNYMSVAQHLLKASVLIRF